MKAFITYFLLLYATTSSFLGSGQEKTALVINLYGSPFRVPLERLKIPVLKPELSSADLQFSFEQLKGGAFAPLIDSMLQYRDQHQLNDWLYYQLLRRVAQSLYPKEANYTAYTVFKWYLLTSSGYDARLALSAGKIIFYVYNNEDISDIPFFMVGTKKYMCLNYHDYANANLNADPPRPVQLDVPAANGSFSYKVTRMPDFKPGDYIDRKLDFVYNHKQYHFNIKQNRELATLFANYPGVDFESYFNIPLSKETYSSLIPLLKKNLAKMDQKKGVDYLMRFTRYAFLYENDQHNFGKEKRMSPEETLSSTYSDCDDRVALFFYLVKEIYNLPMIALLYPSHITMAVAFNRPVGEPIVYNGMIYSVCEPTPEKNDDPIGKIADHLKKVPYQIVYAYHPAQNP